MLPATNIKSLRNSLTKDPVKTEQTKVLFLISLMALAAALYFGDAEPYIRITIKCCVISCVFLKITYERSLAIWDHRAKQKQSVSTQRY